MFILPADGATVEFVRSTECPANFADLNPLNCHVWSKLEQVVYRY